MSYLRLADEKFLSCEGGKCLSILEWDTGVLVQPVLPDNGGFLFFSRTFLSFFLGLHVLLRLVRHLNSSPFAVAFLLLWAFSRGAGSIMGGNGRRLASAVLWRKGTVADRAEGVEDEIGSNEGREGVACDEGLGPGRREVSGFLSKQVLRNGNGNV